MNFNNLHITFEKSATKEDPSNKTTFERPYEVRQLFSRASVQRANDFRLDQTVLLTDKRKKSKLISFDRKMSKTRASIDRFGVLWRNYNS